jgi:hypothetical protein
MYEVPLEDTLHHIENSTWKGIIEFGKYLLSRKGIVGNTVSPMSIFAHSTHFDDHTAAVISPIPSAAIGGDRPDLEIMPVPHWCSDLPYENKKGFFSFLLCIVQPRSVGSVRLASRDSHARPSVDLGFLSNPEDFVTFRRGVTLCLRLAEEVRRQGYHMKDFQVPPSEKGSDNYSHVLSLRFLLQDGTSRGRWGGQRQPAGIWCAWIACMRCIYLPVHYVGPHHGPGYCCCGEMRRFDEKVRLNCNIVLQSPSKIYLWSVNIYGVCCEVTGINRGEVLNRFTPDLPGSDGGDLQ